MGCWFSCWNAKVGGLLLVEELGFVPGGLRDGENHSRTPVSSRSAVGLLRPLSRSPNFSNSGVRVIVMINPGERRLDYRVRTSSLSRRCGLHGCAGHGPAPLTLRILRLPLGDL